MPIPDNLTEILAGTATNNAYTDDNIVVTGTRTPGSGGYTPDRGDIPEYVPDEPDIPFGFGDDEEGQGNQESHCGTRRTAPDGTEYYIPPGYEPFSRGPGFPAGHHYMIGPDGALEFTPWWAEQTGKNAQAISESAWEVAGILGVTSLALVKWAPFASGVLAALGLITAGIHPPHVQPPTGPDSPCNH